MFRNAILTVALSTAMLVQPVMASATSLTNGLLKGPMTSQHVNTPNGMSVGDAPKSQIIIPSDDACNANMIADKSGCTRPCATLYADQDDPTHWTFTFPGYDTCNDPTNVDPMIIDFKMQQNNDTCAVGTFASESNNWVDFYAGQWMFCQGENDQYATLVTWNGTHPPVTFKGVGSLIRSRAPRPTQPN